MTWTAIIPLKPDAERKTRLAAVVNEVERARLGLSWFRHVAEALAGAAHVVALAAERPPGWAGEWRRDLGRGLNPELQHAYEALRPGRTAIFHADLPLLAKSDVRALLDAAERAGCAIAPDRHGTGTNGLAIADGRPFRFAFGIDSFARHCAEAAPACAIVERPGLALDVDTPDDLKVALDATPR